jgi:Flp pilus assembly protein TadD
VKKKTRAARPEKPPSPGELAKLEYSKGSWYATRGRFKDSVRHYHKCLQLSPRNYKAMTNLGNVFFDLGRNAEAVRLYHEAVRVKPTYAKAWCNLGHTFLVMGKWPEARAASQQAIKLEPDDSTAWNNLGYALNELGHPDESIKALKKAVKLESGSPEAHFNLGIAQLLNGNLRAATKEIDVLEWLDDEYAMRLGSYISDWVHEDPTLLAQAKKKKVPLENLSKRAGRR